jgi:Arm DNA-binding domain
MLSDTQIRSTKLAAKALRLYDERGLCLEVTPSGGRWWRLKDRHDGREELLSMGTCPDMGLKTTREMRDRARTACTGHRPE